MHRLRFIGIGAEKWGNYKYVGSNWSPPAAHWNIYFSDNLFYRRCSGVCSCYFFNQGRPGWATHPMTAWTKENHSTLKQLRFYSIQGREIPFYVFNNGEPTALVIGGIHGDELCGVELARGLVNQLASSGAADMKGRVVIIPLANPDGFIAGTRVNARGVDINRNFPTKDFRQGEFSKNCDPGSRAASEPETGAILQLASQFKPKLILTFHADLGCVNYDGPASRIAAAISAYDGLPVRKDIGYRTPGSLGTYFGVERKIPVITLELIPGDHQWQRHGKAILQAMQML
jgi:Predicted deacylase